MQLIIEKLGKGKGIGMGWSKRKTVVVKPYEKENQKPVIKASICNGEQVAGFKDIHTGKIEEIMLIKCPEDMERFKEIYGMRGISEMHLFSANYTNHAKRYSHETTEYLEEFLRNLLLNADKHSPASSARSTKRWVRGMLMSVGVESSH